MDHDEVFNRLGGIRWCTRSNRSCWNPYFVDFVSKTRLSIPSFGVSGDITGWSTVSTPSLDAYSLIGPLEYMSVFSRKGPCLFKTFPP